MILTTSTGARLLSTPELIAYIAGLSAGVRSSMVAPDYKDHPRIEAFKDGFLHGLQV